MTTRITEKELTRDEILQQTRDWMLHSGIQNQSEDPKLHGAINAWHDVEQDSYPYMYSEITGYGLSALAHFADTYGDNELLRERIRDAHTWIATQALHESGGVLTRDYYPDSAAYNEHFDFKNQTLYTFDTGMVLNGLMAAWNITKDKSLITTATAHARFLMSAQKDDGSIYAYYEPSNDAWIDTPEKWSSQSGAYHAKCAIGLYQLGIVREDDRYTNAALALCDYALSMQKEDGRFPSFAGTTDTELHPHSYTIEGLTFVGTKADRKDYLDAAKRGVEWSLTMQQSEGGIARSVHDETPNTNERVDVLAQTLRMASVHRVNEKDALNALEQRISQYVHSNGAHSGFKYGSDNEGRSQPHVNAWVTMFALQALSYKKNLDNDEQINLASLI